MKNSTVIASYVFGETLGQESLQSFIEDGISNFVISQRAQMKAVVAVLIEKTIRSRISSRSKQVCESLSLLKTI
jgi:hypothetical protein